MRSVFTLILFIISLHGFAQQSLTNIPVHDPVIIQQDSVYYIFCTGRGISVWSSTDLTNWKKEQPVFDTLPWAVNTIKGFTNHIWAPDISFYNGQYYLYYSISVFGKNSSCIGVATNKTLHRSSPGFKWVDHGRVLQSYPGITNWNAIDPNVVADNNGDAWLNFGSFWGGIKQIPLTRDRLHVKGDTINVATIASRKTPEAIKDTGNNAIEAPFVFYKNGYYYLFASIDYCCRGAKSTYKMIVGRSKNINGPFVDKTGIDMDKGGGSILLRGDSNWYGVGHNAVASFDGVDYIVFHGYSAADGGRSKLRIEKLQWQDGWPVVAH
ncbi:family 43 glycosylhydrolase [Ferruginibacter sp.]